MNVLTTNTLHFQLTKYIMTNLPERMLLCASTGLVQGRCCKHRPCTGSVLVRNSMLFWIMLLNAHFEQ